MNTSQAAQLLDQGDSVQLSEMQQIMTRTMKAIHDVCVKHNLRYFLSWGSLLGAVRHNGFIPWDDDMDINMPREDYYRFLEIAQEELGDQYFLQTPETDPHWTTVNIPAKVRDNFSTLVEEPGSKYHQGAYVDIFPIDDVVDPIQFEKIRKRCGLLSSLRMRISFHELSGIKRYLRIAMQLAIRLVPARTLYRYLNRQAKKLLALGESDTLQEGIEILDRATYRREDLFPLQLHAFGEYEFYIPNNAHQVLTNYFGDYMQLPPEEKRVPHGVFYSSKRLYDLPPKR